MEDVLSMPWATKSPRMRRQAGPRGAPVGRLLTRQRSLLNAGSASIVTIA